MNFHGRMRITSTGLPYARRPTQTQQLALWGRAFSGAPQNEVGVWQEENSHLNFDFFTRLSTTAMVQEVLSHHGHIDFVGLHPTRKQTFDAYLPRNAEGGRTGRNNWQNSTICSTGSTRHVKCKSTVPTAIPLSRSPCGTMGRVQGRRQTDLSFVGKWVRYRGISALCTSRRDSMRGRAHYDVSFRGVPSAGQITAAVAIPLIRSLIIAALRFAPEGFFIATSFVDWSGLGIDIHSAMVYYTYNKINHTQEPTKMRLRTPRIEFGRPRQAPTAAIDRCCQRNSRKRRDGEPTSSIGNFAVVYCGAGIPLCK